VRLQHGPIPGTRSAIAREEALQPGHTSSSMHLCAYTRTHACIQLDQRATINLIDAFTDSNAYPDCILVWWADSIDACRMMQIP
jgi:hypothetical protein